MATLTSAQQALVNTAKAGGTVTSAQMTAAGFTPSTFNSAVLGIGSGSNTTTTTPVTPVAPTQTTAQTNAANAIQQLQTYSPNTYNALQTAGLLDQLQQQMISSNNFNAGTLAQPLLTTYQQQQTAAQAAAAQQAAAQQAAQVQAQQAAVAQQQAQAQAAAQAAAQAQAQQVAQQQAQIQAAQQAAQVQAQQAAAAQAAQVQAQNQAIAQAQQVAAQQAAQQAAAQAAQVQAQQQAQTAAQQAAGAAAQQAYAQQQAQILAQNNTAGPVTPVDPVTAAMQQLQQSQPTLYNQLTPDQLTQVQQAVAQGQDPGQVAQNIIAGTQQAAQAAYVAAHPELQQNTAAAIGAGEQANAAASQAAAAAANPENTWAGVTNAISNGLSSIGSFVDNSIPGGWATIGGAALLAVGIANPELLGLADSGTLTPEALTTAGVDPATVSTQIANGLTSGSIAPESVGLSAAPTIGADGTVTTVATDGATTTAAADGTVSTTAADGTVAPTTASGTASTASTSETAALNANQVGALDTTAPVTPSTVPANTISTTLPDGSVGAYDPATGTVYNADGTVNAAATNAAPTPGAGTQIASTTPVAPSEVAGLNTSQVGALDTTGATTGGSPLTGAGQSLSNAGQAVSNAFSGSSINPIANALTNAGITSPILNGALTGAATSAGIDLITGKPITGSGLLTAAATGGLAGEIGTFLPDATGSTLQAAINGAVTSAGANAIVDVATGKPITATTLAEQAAIGGAIGAAVSGFNSSVNNANGTTTYTWDDGSQMTTNSSGTPVNVTDSSGAVVSLGTVNPTTGSVTPNSAVVTPAAPGAPITAAPVAPANTNGATPVTTTTNPDGTTTTLYSDASTTTQDTNGQVIASTSGTTAPSTIDNGNGTSTNIYSDGSTTVTDNASGNTLTVTAPSTPEVPNPSATVPTSQIPTTTATQPAGTVNNGNGTSTQTFEDGSQLTTDNTTGDVVNSTASTDNGTTGATVDAGTAAAVGATTAGAATTPATYSTPSQGFLPIPKFTGEALTNPGTNPGYIEPTPQYNPSGVAGLDQYYWGQQGVNAPAAPATGYGQASQLGQLITPQVLGFPTAQSMAAAGLQYNPQIGILQRDVYNNPVQMNTLAPAVPGVANAYGPTTPAQSATGQGGGVQLGQNLNYVAPSMQLTGTPSAGLVAPGTFTAISPEDLATQLSSQATAAGLASAGTTAH